MSGTQQTINSVLKLLGAFIVMAIAYFLSTKILGQSSASMTPEEINQAGRAFIVVSFVNALILSYIIIRSRWFGLKLIVILIIVHFGVETFMAQIETLYFNSAVEMETAEFTSILSAGAIRAIIFAPFATLIFGKLRSLETFKERQPIGIYLHAYRKRFLALAALYVIIYFVFGYFVAWQWEETRLYYSGTTAIKPFLAHFRDLFVIEDPVILPFQFLRGALWTALTLIIVKMIKAKRWETSLAVGSTFAGLLGLPLGLFPNPYFPPMVAQAHFVEVTLSMLLFGSIAGWLVYGVDD